MIGELKEPSGSKSHQQLLAIIFELLMRVEPPCPRSLDRMRADPQHNIVIFLLPDAEAAGHPGVEIPIIRWATDYPAISNVAHAIEPKGEWGIIPVRHFAKQIGDGAMDQAVWDDPPPCWRSSPIGLIIEIHTMGGKDR